MFGRKNLNVYAKIYSIFLVNLLVIGVLHLPLERKVELTTLSPIVIKMGMMNFSMVLGAMIQNHQTTGKKSLRL